MSAFFLLYALAISIELILSLVMAVFLFLILAPSSQAAERQPTELPRDRPLARTVEGALGDVFATVSEGRDDLHTITHARALLARYARERHDQRSGAAGRPHSA